MEAYDQVAHGSQENVGKIHLKRRGPDSFGSPGNRKYLKRAQGSSARTTSIFLSLLLKCERVKFALVEPCSYQEALKSAGTGKHGWLNKITACSGVGLALETDRPGMREPWEVQKVIKDVLECSQIASEGLKGASVEGGKRN